MHGQRTDARRSHGEPRRVPQATGAVSRQRAGSRASCSDNEQEREDGAADTGDPDRVCRRRQVRDLAEHDCLELSRQP